MWLCACVLKLTAKSGKDGESKEFQIKEEKKLSAHKKLLHSEIDEERQNEI